MLPSGDLPNPGIKPGFPALQVDYLQSEPPGKPKNTRVGKLSLLQQVFLTQELDQVRELQVDSFPAELRGSVLMPGQSIDF